MKREMSVDPQVVRELVVVGVARDDDRLVHVDEPVAADLVVAEGVAAEVEIARIARSPGSGVRLPKKSAASAMNGLNVEPGG